SPCPPVISQRASFTKSLYTHGIARSLGSVPVSPVPLDKRSEATNTGQLAPYGLSRIVRMHSTRSPKATSTNASSNSDLQAVFNSTRLATQKTAAGKFDKSPQSRRLAGD